MSMRFDIITIFQHIFSSYFKESILKRAQKKKLIEIHTHDLRAYTRDKHRKTDDTPYGGGAGMVMMAEPILRAVEAVMKKSKIKNQRSKIIVFSAKGTMFNQKMADHWSQKYNHIVFVTGRYEGIDERAATILKKEYGKSFEEVSIGPYVLTDGDVAAMVVISAVARLIPGVIRTESLHEESHLNILLKREPQLSTKNYKLKTSLEYPHYTRPEIFMWPPRQQSKKSKKYSVPRVLLSGNHAKIAAWRKSKMK
ncbi:MAG TPA: tRNA (guanosine(37)-N1)-methyltransferase TrmD [Candidatus Paceibacterota bacterium]